MRIISTTDSENIHRKRFWALNLKMVICYKHLFATTLLDSVVNTYYNHFETPTSPPPPPSLQFTHPFGEIVNECYYSLILFPQAREPRNGWNILETPHQVPPPSSCPRMLKWIFITPFPLPSFRTSTWGDQFETSFQRLTFSPCLRTGEWLFMTSNFPSRLFSSRTLCLWTLYDDTFTLGHTLVGDKNQLILFFWRFI